MALSEAERRYRASAKGKSSRSAAKKREKQKATPEQRRHFQLRKKYKIGLDEVLDIYQSQRGKCAICEKEISFLMTEQKSVACLDHCHSTGKIRGFLCHGCNIGLGGFRDASELLNKAISYLSKS